MGTTDIAVCNQALRLVRANSITSLDTSVDTSNEAEICSLYYTDFVEDMLTRYPWAFALKKAQLVATTAPVNEWRYAHNIPTEALRIWAAYPSSDVGARPIVNYDISAQPGTRVLNSNNSTVYAEYTVDVAETNWPAYFTHFAIHAFAALIAVPVTDDVELSQRLQAIAWGTPSEGEKGGKFAVAAGIDGQQQPPETIANSPLVEARFS